MTTTVKTRIIKIGNSQGVRIPKILLEQADLGEEIELRLEERQIIIQPAQSPRAGWATQFQSMAESGDDQLLDDQDLFSDDFNEDEWTW